MHKPTLPILGFVLAGVLALLITAAHADTFGSGANAGDLDDAGAGGGSFSSPFGGVLTEYRMGKLEISQESRLDVAGPETARISIWLVFHQVAPASGALSSARPVTPKPPP